MADIVGDDEDILRKVLALRPGGVAYWKSIEGKIVVTSAAFYEPAHTEDGSFQISVDRLQLLSQPVGLSKNDLTKGYSAIVTLNAGRTRQIGSVRDVEFAPLEDNPAHSLICTVAAIPAKAYDKVRQALARLANERDWVIAPPIQ